MDYIDYEKFISYKMAGDFYMWKTFSEHTDLVSVESVLSGFRSTTAQKSSAIDKYFAEFDTITERLPLVNSQVLTSKRVSWNGTGWELLITKSSVGEQNKNRLLRKFRIKR